MFKTIITLLMRVALFVAFLYLWLASFDVATF